MKLLFCFVFILFGCSKNADVGMHLSQPTYYTFVRDGEYHPTAKEIDVMVENVKKIRPPNFPIKSVIIIDEGKYWYLFFALNHTGQGVDDIGKTAFYVSKKTLLPFFNKGGVDAPDIPEDLPDNPILTGLFIFGIEENRAYFPSRKKRPYASIPPHLDL